MLTQLQKLGLSENEAKVYLAMLELGPATMLEIATKADVNRPTAYVQVEVLKKRGLVSIQTKGKKTLFIAESPEQLENLLEREKQEMEEKKGDLEKILPQLTSLFNTSDQRPEIRYFEGKEGLIKIQDEFLKNKSKEVISLSSVDNVIEIFPDHPKKYTNRRVERGIRSRLIYTSKRGPFLKNDSDLMRETRFISPDKLPFSLDIAVYDDIVAIANLKGKISGALIRHQEIANSFRGILEFIWNISDTIE